MLKSPEKLTNIHTQSLSQSMSMLPNKVLTASGIKLQNPHEKEDDKELLREETRPGVSLESLCEVNTHFHLLLSSDKG